MSTERNVILRTLCFFSALEYPPTEQELYLHAETPEVIEDSAWQSALNQLITESVVLRRHGRVALTENESFFAEHEKREALFERKFAKTKRFLSFLQRLDGIRCVAICNTTALRHASEESDIDLFLICKKGSLWQTRLFATLYLQLKGWRVESGSKDPFCLTFFVSDDHLDLAQYAIHHDVYLRHWFVSLMPILDRGIIQQFWQQNAELRSQLAHAVPWPDALHGAPSGMIPVSKWIEKLARWISLKKLPYILRSSMNKDTCVVIHDDVLKFHVDDRREYYRNRYEERCKRYHLA